MSSTAGTERRNTAAPSTAALAWGLSVLGLALAYAVVGRLGLTFAQHQKNATLIWAPTGLSLAALLLYGRRLWPGVFLGALAVNLSIDTAPLAALGISLGNTLEAVVGVTLLERLGKLSPRLARTRDVLSLLLWGAVVCTLVGASIGVTTLYLAGALPEGAAGVTFLDWWLGDAGGALVVTPLLLVAAEGTPPWSQLMRRGELWIAMLLLAGLLFVAFGGVVPRGWMRWLASFPPFALMVWVGLRLGPRGAVLASFLVALAATLGTAQGIGPFPVASGAPLLLAYVTTMALTATLLAASTAERDAALEAQIDHERQRRELEDRLRHKQRLESLGTLAGGVAHDFNNLLGVVRGNTGLIRSALAETDRGGECGDYVEEIDQAAIHAADICRQLLTYAGRAEPRTTRLDLPPLVAELRDLLASGLPKTVRLTNDLPADLAALRADPTQVRQVLMNLVLNAADAIGDGGGAIHIRAREVERDATALAEARLSDGAQPGPFVELEVQDDGEGMDEATLGKMFDAFYTTKQQGRGLGMATVAGIVKAHGGAVTVRSTPGGGTTLRVFWPRWEEEAPAAREAEGAAAEASEAAGAGAADADAEASNGVGSITAPPRPTVLLVDDNPDVLRVTHRVLEALHYDVVEAPDGQQALARWTDEPGRFDVMLIDVSMPGLTGPQTVRRIRELGGQIPLVLMSGYSDETIEASVGHDAFIAKPFDVDDLVEVLEGAQRARKAAS